MFIEAGLIPALKEKADLQILEMGWGTGLNALLTNRAMGPKHQVHYVGVEAHPVPWETARQLNYPALIQDGAPLEEWFREMHQAPWDVWWARGAFHLYKFQGRIEAFVPDREFDLVYYDAFAPGAQPELWTEALFSRIFHMCHPGAIWVSYSAKGDVRRALQAAGFEVEKLPGPPGKREMLRARKPHEYFL